MNKPMTRITIGAGLTAGATAVLLADVSLFRQPEHDFAPCFWTLLIASLAMGCIEFTKMLRAKDLPVRPVIALAFVLLLQGCAWLEVYQAPFIHNLLHGHGLELYLLLIIALIYTTFVAEFWGVERGGRDMGRAMASVGWTVLVVLTVGLLGVFLAKIRFLAPHDPMRGLVYLALALGTVKAADIGAYTVGSLIGRHLLVPKSSPKKTVEGLFGAMAMGIGAAMAIGIGLGGFAWPEMLVFGAAVSISGVLGDLAESLIKRTCAIKDSGRIPGFGGALDILDSMLAAGPVAYLVLVVLTGTPGVA
jgi:phosphatidate cytidylyltransferase